MMTGAPELIAQLDGLSAFHRFAAIAVSFALADPDTALFIETHDPRRQEVLEEAVRAGARPVGAIVADMAGTKVTIRAMVYPENADRHEEEAYLGELVPSVTRFVIAAHDKLDGPRGQELDHDELDDLLHEPEEN
jgi:hypothetical protein